MSAVFGKTPITVLQEYCAKKGLDKPIYTCVESSDQSKSFICRIDALNMWADGIGRSKREAKHDAAANLSKMVKLTHPDIENIPQIQHEIIPITDAVTVLRDLCLQHDHPLPSFEVVQQSGPPEAPEFQVQCSVATIVRFGSAATKKAAKQKAAQKILQIIRSIPNYNEENQIATLQEVSEQDNENNRKKILTYRDLINSDIKPQSGTPLSDRHNYFKNLPSDMRADALNVLKSEMFSDKNKFDDLMKVLNIKYRIQDVPATEENLIFIELLCDFDCVFAGNVFKIYSRIIHYFEDMLI